MRSIVACIALNGRLSVGSIARGAQVHALQLKSQSESNFNRSFHHEIKSPKSQP